MLSVRDYRGRNGKKKFIVRKRAEKFLEGAGDPLLLQLDAIIFTDEATSLSVDNILRWKSSLARYWGSEIVPDLQLPYGIGATYAASNTVDCLRQQSTDSSSPSRRQNIIC